MAFRERSIESRLPKNKEHLQHRFQNKPLNVQIKPEIIGLCLLEEEIIHQMHNPPTISPRTIPAKYKRPRIEIHLQDRHLGGCFNHSHIEEAKEEEEDAVYFMVTGYRYHGRRGSAISWKHSLMAKKRGQLQEKKDDVNAI